MDFTAQLGTPDSAPGNIALATTGIMQGPGDVAVGDAAVDGVAASDAAVGGVTVSDA